MRESYELHPELLRELAYHLEARGAVDYRPSMLGEAYEAAAEIASLPYGSPGARAAAQRYTERDLDLILRPDLAVAAVARLEPSRVHRTMRPRFASGVMPDGPEAACDGQHKSGRSGALASRMN